MYLLKLLLILLLIVYPFGELVRIQIAQNIYVKPIDVFSGCIFIIYLYHYIRGRITKHTLLIPALLFSTSALISLIVNASWLHSNDIITSGLYLVRWIIYTSIFFAVSATEHQFKNIYKRLLIIVGFLVVIAGYIQYFFYSNLIPWVKLGWDDHLYRLFSVFLDPNFAGAFFVLYFIFIAGLSYKISLSKKTQYLVFQNYRVTKHVALVILGSISILSILASLLTFSRSALLMLIVSTIVFMVLINKKKLIGIFIIILSIFILVISPYFKFENINLLRGASSYARIVNYGNALSVFIDKPLLGVGFNTYRYAKTKYGIQTGWSSAPSHSDAGVDNSFLFVLVTTGLIGFCSYLMFWKSFLQEAFSSYNKSKDLLALIIIASTIGLFIHALFINSLFFPEIMLWMAIVYGLLL